VTHKIDFCKSNVEEGCFKEGEGIMGEILQQSFILILFVILGYVLKKIGLFGRLDYRVVTRLVMYVTLPCTIINGFTRFEWDNALFVIPVMAIGVNTVLQIWSYIAAKRGTDNDKIFYMLNVPGFSTGTFAMPFIQNSMGVEGIVAACMFDVGGTIMPSGLSYVCTSAVLKKNTQRAGIGFVLKRMFTSPPFVANLCMIFLKVAGVTFPDGFMNFVHKGSDANTLLCMMMIGMMFEIKFQRENLLKTGKVIAMRLIVSTLTAVFIMTCMPLDITLKKALVVVAFSPIAAMSLVFTDKMEGDTELAGFVNSVSIIISMIIMTVLMAVL
jgi:predicted permease